MFKFMKSKKGFTLVELMIVVVIMAILVAVAVPIFSAVTSNARKKTCAANQREIQSQFNNADMGGILTFDDGEEFTLTTVGSFTVTSAGVVTAGASDDTKYTAEMFKGLFQEVPTCPNEGIFTVSIKAATVGTVNETTATVVVACNSHTNADGSAVANDEIEASDTAHPVQTAA